MALPGEQVKHVVVSLSEELSAKPKDEQSKALDEELEAFNQFMIHFPDFRAQGPLLPQERALLKTYLVHTLNGNIDRGDNGTPKG
jgi:hypothetical protein